MARIAALLNEHNVRTFRLDWRGCGAGVALARYPYHSGRSNDALATIAAIKVRCPGSPISVIGFSLGGNVALKMLGEAGNASGILSEIDRAVAVCPPIDLSGTVQALRNGLARFYDGFFCRACTRDVRHRQHLRPDAVVPDGWSSRLPKTLYEFDDTFTAPVCGFASAFDYYAKSSANQFLSAIEIPTLIIAAQDDPVVPFQQFQAADYSPTTKLLAPYHGGHMGFCTPRGLGWLVRQIVEWAVVRP
jgi:predicted alpha/beta-fold hydrolase